MSGSGLRFGGVKCLGERLTVKCQPCLQQQAFSIVFVTSSGSALMLHTAIKPRSPSFATSGQMTSSSCDGASGGPPGDEEASTAQRAVSPLFSRSAGRPATPSD